MRKFFKMFGLAITYAATFLCGMVVLRKLQLAHPLDRIETEEDEE